VLTEKKAKSTSLNNVMIKTLMIDEVAARLGKTKKTVHADMVRRPQSIPPWFKLPGSKKPFWLEATVDQFLLKQAARAGALPDDAKRP